MQTQLDEALMNKEHSPVQVMPSPWKPGEHSQRYGCPVKEVRLYQRSEHLPNSLQLCNSSEHSSNASEML